jgi:hypothetical protein
MFAVSIKKRKLLQGPQGLNNQKAKPPENPIRITFLPF